MAPRIYLVRHGETLWSISGQYTGRTDLSLTPRGRDAARELGERIRHVAFTHVLTSPLRRARETCGLARLATAPEIEPDLVEWDYGDDEGRPSAEVLQARPTWNLFRDGAPRGESPAQVGIRADRLIARLRGLDGNVILFSHGHFARVFAVRWIGLEVAQAQHFLLNTTSLSILGYEHERFEVPAILLWNSVAHECFGEELQHGIRDTRSMKQRAIERWENEGGEIPAEQAFNAEILETSHPAAGRLST